MANQVYPNIVIEKKYVDVLTTLLDLGNYCTIKNITKGAGDTIRVVKRSVTGAVDEVAMGEGNTNTIETTSQYADYVLVTSQGKGVLHDEEEQQDADALDTLLKGMGQKMVNKWNADIMEEYNKAWANEVAGSITYDNICDAIALFGEQSEQKSALVHPSGVAALRKELKTLLSYNEAFVRTGYIGTVNGVPVYSSKAVPENEIIISDSTAINLYLNKEQEIEQYRDAEHRATQYFIRTVAKPALVDASHVARVAAAAAVTTTCTTYTKNAKVVAGAGAGVAYIYINSKLDGTADCASNAYSYTASANLASGDVIEVVCKQDGHVSSSVTVTVA